MRTNQISILFAVLSAISALSIGRVMGGDLPPLEDAPAPTNVTDATEAAGVTSWGIGPFVRCPHNPLIVPRDDTTFFCPILKQNVPWEQKNIVGAAAAVKEARFIGCTGRNQIIFIILASASGSARMESILIGPAERRMVDS